MRKGSNFIYEYSLTGFHRHIYSFFYSVNSSNPSFNIYLLYVLLTMAPGNKKMNGKDKDSFPCGTYILVGELLNIQVSLCGREHMTLGSPLSSGHYFQWICRKRGFLNFLFVCLFLVEAELNFRSLFFLGLGGETCVLSPA